MDDVVIARPANGVDFHREVEVQVDRHRAVENVVVEVQRGLFQLNRDGAVAWQTRALAGGEGGDRTVPRTALGVVHYLGGDVLHDAPALDRVGDAFEVNFAVGTFKHE